MKTLLQRVSRASVKIEGSRVGEIEQGLLLLVGFGRDDTDNDLRWMLNKILGLRIFPDAFGNMNLSVNDIKGELLTVSQFTLHADCRKGKRPSFMKTAEPQTAELLYDLFVQMIENSGLVSQSGKFGAMMQVELVNDGPVTILLDSPSERKSGSE